MSARSRLLDFHASKALTSLGLAMTLCFAAAEGQERDLRIGTCDGTDYPCE